MEDWQQHPCEPCSKLTQRMRAELRRARLQFKKGQLSAADYEKVVNEYMQYAIREQERIGLDVLVHGEPERTDMCVALPAPRGWLSLWFSTLSCTPLVSHVLAWRTCHFLT